MPKAAARGKRFLGLELGGSRRTALVALEWYESERKAFLREIDSPVVLLGDDTPDEALVRAVNGAEADLLGVDAPLTLPPCFHCPDCRGVRHCGRPEVAWMREEALRQKAKKLPIPYLQRPVDLLLRGRWQDEAITPFPVEDTFGANRAPLAARMEFLKPQLRTGLLEVNPRLSLGCIARWFGISAREVRRSRDIEEGAEQRMGILDAMGQVPRIPRLPHLFLYKSDIVSLAQDLSAFDAFLCAYSALLKEAGFLEEAAFPAAWGNVAKPLRLDTARGGEP